jgi:hypothetical protein
MGVRLQLSPHLLRLMSPEDQAHFDLVPGTTLVPLPDGHPSPKGGDSEKMEQKQFAHYLKSENEKGRAIPWVWWPLHTKSRTSPGAGDFWVGISGRSLWFEFKAGPDKELSPVQKEFRRRCLIQGVEHIVVFSARQAIEIVQQADAGNRQKKDKRSKNRLSLNSSQIR